MKVSIQFVGQTKENLNVAVKVDIMSSYVNVLRVDGNAASQPAIGDELLRKGEGTRKSLFL